MRPINNGSGGVLDTVDREASRILQQIVDTLDIRTMPDGQVLFRFTGDQVLLERLGVWGSELADLEPDADAEDDGRSHEPMRQVPPVSDLSPLFPLEQGVPQEMAGLVLRLMEAKAA